MSAITITKKRLVGCLLLAALGGAIIGFGLGNFATVKAIQSLVQRGEAPSACRR